jgi:hypothetical protein
MGAVLALLACTTAVAVATAAPFPPGLSVLAASGAAVVIRFVRAGIHLGAWLATLGTFVAFTTAAVATVAPVLAWTAFGALFGATVVSGCRCRAGLQTDLRIQWRALGVKTLALGASLALATASAAAATTAALTATFATRTTAFGAGFVVAPFATAIAGLVVAMGVSVAATISAFDGLGSR